MKKQSTENFLDNIPVRNPAIRWSVGEDNLVTLEVENTGFMKRLTQKLFKKPKVSYIHLDETGSFIWQLLDGKRDITALSIPIKEHFGDAAEPLYERLSKYLSILASYDFITFA